MRDAERIEAIENDAEKPTNPRPKYRPGHNPNSRKNLCAPWKPGDIPNPHGRPKRDAAAEIARKVFELNEELIYKGYVEALRKGSGFTFQVLSDRAYGKLKEQVELSGNISTRERLEKARKRNAK